MTPLAASRARFLRRELVRRSFLVGSMPPLAASLARFLRRELVGSALLVGGMASLARYLALLLFIHRSKSPPARPSGLSLTTPAAFLSFLVSSPPVRCRTTLAARIMFFFVVHGSGTSLAFMAAPVIATPISI
jgi:hypothetical protein